MFKVQPMDKVRYSLTISSNHNQLAPENMFYLALSQPLCLQVICTPIEKKLVAEWIITSLRLLSGLEDNELGSGTASLKFRVESKECYKSQGY